MIHRVPPGNRSFLLKKSRVLDIKPAHQFSIPTFTRSWWLVCLRIEELGFLFC